MSQHIEGILYRSGEGLVGADGRQRGDIRTVKGFQAVVKRLFSKSIVLNVLLEAPDVAHRAQAMITWDEKQLTQEFPLV